MRFMRNDMLRMGRTTLWALAFLGLTGLAAVNDDNGCGGDSKPVTGATCEAATDCKGDPGVDCVGAWACVEGGCAFECAPETAGCYTDRDCGDGLVCNAAEVCEAPPCRPGEPCPDVCFGACVEPPAVATCTSSDMCPEGTHCSTEDGVCDSACRPGADTCVAVCAGTCVEDVARACFDDAECGAGEFCDRDPCVYPGGVPDSSGDAAFACGGVCAPREGCATDADCGRDEFCGCGPMPVMPNGLMPCYLQCLPKAGGCASDAECGVGFLCEAGLCVERRTTCGSSADCPAGWLCEASCGTPDSAGRPAPCESYCVPPGPVCDDGTVCASGEMCQIDCQTNCPPCECPPGESCACPCTAECVTSCVSAGCRSDGDCAAGEVCALEFCADGTVCGGRCEPAPLDCKQDSDCIDASGQAGVCEIKVCEDALPCDPNQSCPAPACYGTCRYDAPKTCTPEADTCPAGTHCEAVSSCGGPGFGIPCMVDYQCVPDEPTSACIRTGCSRQLCAPEPMASTCEWAEWYICYDLAKCEADAAGVCGWQPNPEFDACMQAYGAP